MFSVRFELGAAGNERKAIADGGQYVLDRPTSRRMIDNLSRRDDRKSITFRPLTYPRFLHYFMLSPMAAYHAIEPVAKGFMEMGRNTIRLNLP